MHAGMGIVFAIVHAGAFNALDLTSALVAWAVLFGFVHNLIVGIGMGMIGTMHPLMRADKLNNESTPLRVGDDRCDHQSPVQSLNDSARGVAPFKILRRRTSGSDRS